MELQLPAAGRQVHLVGETWAVGPAPTPYMLIAQRISADGITGVEMQRRNVRITLQNLKRRLESEAELAVPKI